MGRRQKRVRHRRVTSTLVGLALVASGCQSTSDQNRYRPTDESPPLVDAKYSLAADREKLEELRKEVPAETKQANDEEALILQLFADTKREPSAIRRTFDQMLRKKRDQMERDLKQERETFNRGEKTARDQFLKEQARTRDATKGQKRTREETKQFYDDQDAARRAYFANERDRRQDFESQIREKRKNFEDYTRSKTNEFNAEMRAFEKRRRDEQEAARKAAKQKP